MKIGLLDVDKGKTFPNLALMKISAYHKGRGGGRLSRQHQRQRRCCHGRGQSIKSKRCAPDTKRTCTTC